MPKKPFHTHGIPYHARLGPLLTGLETAVLLFLWLLLIILSNRCIYVNRGKKWNWMEFLDMVNLRTHSLQTMWDKQDKNKQTKTIGWSKFRFVCMEQFPHFVCSFHPWNWCMKITMRKTKLVICTLVWKVLNVAKLFFFFFGLSSLKSRASSQVSHSHICSEG